MRPFFSLLAVLAVTACTDKTPATDSGDTQPQDTDTDTQDTDTGEAPPVWEELRIETSNTLTGLYPTGSGLVVVSQGGKAWLRSSGAWSSMDLDTDGEDLNDLWGSGGESDLSMVAVGNAGVIATYTSGVWTTEDIGTANLLAVDGPSADNLLAVGWGGVFAYTGPGDTGESGWQYQDVAVGRRFNDIWWDGSAAMAVGEDGDFVVYNGETWADDALSGRETLYAIHGTASNDLWAVGEDGASFHWDGSAWTANGPETENSLWGVWAASATEVYVVGNNGGAWVYNGTEWSELPTGVDNNLFGVDSTGNGNVWAIGNRGMVIQYSGATASEG